MLKLLPPLTIPVETLMRALAMIEKAVLECVHGDETRTAAA
ncbi:hypothetical protein [Salinarimonas sp.]